MKPILISGVQPTGKLHLGNYLGALKNFVELQNSGKYQCYFFIADLHALTENPEPRELQKNILDLELSFLAIGLDSKKSTLFVQSTISAHPALALILNNLTPLSELRRMTQFKEKSESAPQNINVGLFTYPTLMAADILLYDAAFVPVGEDQLQHLELTRTLARKFNAKFGKTFVEPKPLLTEVPRLMSLDDPTKKMSKSHPAGCLFLDDSPQTMRAKIGRATTDSGKEIRYSPQSKPGISNLLKIYESLSGKSLKLIEARYKNKGYAEFKKDLAEVVVKALESFQKNKKILKAKSSQLKAVLAAGDVKAQKVAGKKLLEVKKKIGLKI